MRYQSQRYRPEKHYMRGPGPAWIEKHIAHRTEFNHFTRIHHDDVVTQLGNDTQVVRNKQNGAAKIPL